MTTYTLTKSSPEQLFNLNVDSDVQVLISDDSEFEGAIFRIEHETDDLDTFIPVPGTRTTQPYSRIFMFTSGKLKLTLIGNPDKGDGTTNVVVDVNRIN